MGNEVRPDAGPGEFTATHWSVVLGLRGRDSPQAQAALETLCRSYWYPLYAYARRRGERAEDAEDLTQAFFARLIAGNGLAGVERDRASFRSYLLGAFNHFLADARDHARRLKRGGGRVVESLDVGMGESRYASAPVEQGSPDRLFDRRWALTVLKQVLGRLRGEYEQAGKGRLFARLSPLLVGDVEECGYHALALEFQMTEGAVRVAVHRLRRRYGSIFAEEVARTVSDPAEVEGEMRHLLAALGE